MTQLSDLISQVRQRVNVETSPNITDSSRFAQDAEITNYINEAGAELYTLLTQTSQHYFTTIGSIIITAPNVTAPLPNDFYKLTQIQKQFADRWINCREISTDEIAYYSSSASYLYYADIGNVYNILGNTIFFYPETQASGTYKIIYTPIYTNLVNSTDPVVYPQNWHNYMVLYAALQLRIKENIGSSDDIRAQVERMRQIIQDSAINRGQPSSVRLTRNRYYKRFPGTY